jgi:hypothetical protein
MASSHIQTPYANNINDHSDSIPSQSKETDIYKPEGTSVKEIIKINSGIIK